MLPWRHVHEILPIPGPIGLRVPADITNSDLFARRQQFSGGEIERGHREFRSSDRSLIEEGPVVGDAKRSQPAAIRPDLLRVSGRTPVLDRLQPNAGRTAAITDK